MAKYIKTTNKKKCSTDGCHAQTINDKCLNCTARARKANSPYKVCATVGCGKGVRTKTYCGKCEADQKPKMHKCKTEDCTHKTHNEYCAECINRVNRVNNRKPLLTKSQSAIAVNKIKKATKHSLHASIASDPPCRHEVMGHDPRFCLPEIETEVKLTHRQPSPFETKPSQPQPVETQPSPVETQPPQQQQRQPGVVIIEDNIASASESKDDSSDDSSDSDRPMTLDELLDELDLLFIDYGISSKRERCNMINLIAAMVPPRS